MSDKTLRSKKYSFKFLLLLVLFYWDNLPFLLNDFVVKESKKNTLDSLKVNGCINDPISDRQVLLQKKNPLRPPAEVQARLVWRLSFR